VSDFPFVRQALEATADDRFSTPLIDAVNGISGIPVAVALDLYPGSVNDRDVGGRTALHWAVCGGDIEAVRLLLSFHADPSVADFNQQTPLHFAALYANLPILQALLEARSNVHARALDGHSPLHLAVECMVRDNVTALIRAGAKADAVDHDGKSAFASAASRRTSCTEEEVISLFQLLLENGADLNMVDRLGWRPVDFAIYENNATVFRALYHLKAEYNYLHEDGRTILHCLGKYGRKELLLAMMEMDMSTVNPDHVDHYGYTACDEFDRRQQVPPVKLHPAQTIPTAEEGELFYQLLEQMRDRYIGLTDIHSEEEGESEDGHDEDSGSQGASDVGQEQARPLKDKSDDEEEEEEEWLDAEEVVQGDVC
jgi:ankyrin repeat protein